MKSLFKILNRPHPSWKFSSRIDIWAPPIISIDVDNKEIKKKQYLIP